MWPEKVWQTTYNDEGVKKKVAVKEARKLTSSTHQVVSVTV